jgi:hypothetical protein
MDLANGRRYPKDEAHVVYKSFDAVSDSVKFAGPASEVAGMKAGFVVKCGCERVPRSMADSYR